MCILDAMASQGREHNWEKERNKTFSEISATDVDRIVVRWIKPRCKHVQQELGILKLFPCKFAR